MQSEWCWYLTLQQKIEIHKLKFNVNMSTINKKVLDEINFTGPAIYKIVIMGELEHQTAEQYWGMKITHIKNEGNKTISTMIGMIRDQSELSGIIISLHDMHITVISVNMLTEVDGQ